MVLPLLANVSARVTFVVFTCKDMEKILSIYIISIIKKIFVHFEDHIKQVCIIIF